MEDSHRIQIFGATWCADCRRAKQFLDEHGISYDWLDVEDNDELLDLVMSYNKGMQSIPTILFPDGSVMVEPKNAELARKPGIKTSP